MTATVSRAKVTRISGDFVYVAVSRMGANVERGPLTKLSGVSLAVGDDVLVANVGVVKEDIVLIAGVGDGNGLANLDGVTITGLAAGDMLIYNGSLWVNAPYLAAGSVGNTQLATNAVTQVKMADNSVGTAEIIDGNVTNAKLATDSVTTIKIQDNAITQAKMADNSVGTAEILDSNVTNAKLATDAVTQAKMADNSVGTNEIINGAVTSAKILDGTIDVADLSTATLNSSSFGMPGVVEMWPGLTAPTSWAFCDGTAYSRATYPNTFAACVKTMGTTTVTIASPGVFTFTSHGMAVGDKIFLSTTGALPTGLTADTVYYVVLVPTANTFQVSATAGGAAINTSGTQSGTHTLYRAPFAGTFSSTTFNVPNFNGRGPIGPGNSGATGATTHTMGQTIGEETHTMTQNELVAHVHDISEQNAVFRPQPVNNATAAGGTGFYQRAGGGATSTSLQALSTGSTTPFNMMQPSLGINFIIKMG